MMAKEDVLFGNIAHKMFCETFFPAVNGGEHLRNGSSGFGPTRHSANRSQFDAFICLDLADPELLVTDHLTSLLGGFGEFQWEENLKGRRYISDRSSRHGVELYTHGIICEIFT